MLSTINNQKPTNRLWNFDLWLIGCPKQDFKFEIIRAHLHRALFTVYLSGTPEHIRQWFSFSDLPVLNPPPPAYHLLPHKLESTCFGLGEEWITRSAISKLPILVDEDTDVAHGARCTARNQF